MRSLEELTFGNASSRLPKEDLFFSYQALLLPLMYNYLNVFSPDLQQALAVSPELFRVLISLQSRLEITKAIGYRCPSPFLCKGAFPANTCGEAFGI